MNFNWRRCFGKLASDLARSVQHHINMQAGQTLREMQDYIIKHNQIETASVQHDLVGGRLDYPVKVAKVTLYSVHFIFTVILNSDYISINI